MLYVYSSKLTPTVIGLLTGLNATRLRRFDGMDFWDKSHRVAAFSPQDAIVCWDKSNVVPELDGVRVLNGQDDARNVVHRYSVLFNAGLPAVERQVGDGLVSYDQYVRAGYVPRLYSGGELLRQEWKDRAIPDYFMRRLDFSSEYRIHSFNGKSIRAGECVLREGFNLTTSDDWKPDAGLAHPWIRTYEGGWTVQYKGFVSSQALRYLAHRAVKALGLTFGVVSIGQTDLEHIYVIDVKTTPELSGETLAAYVKAIYQWYSRIEDKEKE